MSNMGKSTEKLQYRVQPPQNISNKTHTLRMPIQGNEKSRSLSIRTADLN